VKEKDREIEKIKKKIRMVQDVFNKVVQILPSFNITDKHVLPYGLKPHTRSVSWIVEQVVVQQAKYHRKKIETSDKPTPELPSGPIFRPG